MHGTSGLPRFFVEGPPVEDELVFVDEEAEHARKVLRLSVGDRCEALDGAGGSWIAEFCALDRGRAVAKVLESRFRTPQPGAPGGPLPWVELVVAWPRKSRAEEMLGPLTQLGVASIRPLVAQFSGEAPPPDEPPQRWSKLVREATKQCGRRYLPQFEPPLRVEDLIERLEGPATVVLDAAAGSSLDTWLASLPPFGEGRVGTPSRPMRLIVGPEGGWSEEEQQQFRAKGCSFASVGPHVLRIEVAAIAALSVVGVSWRDSVRRRDRE